MRHAFLRPPRGALVVADAVRVLALASVIVAAVARGPADGAILALALGGTVLPRTLVVRPALDAAYGVALLVAAWSGVLDVYTAIAWWDLVVHFVAIGVISLVGVELLTRVGLLVPLGGAPHPRLAHVAQATALGLALAALWEMVEWVGQAFDPTVMVGYDDSISDMAVGALGALVAGLVVLRATPPPSRPAGDSVQAQVGAPADFP